MFPLCCFCYATNDSFNIYTCLSFIILILAFGMSSHQCGKSSKITFQIFNFLFWFLSDPICRMFSCLFVCGNSKPCDWLMWISLAIKLVPGFMVQLYSTSVQLYNCFHFSTFRWPRFLTSLIQAKMSELWYFRRLMSFSVILCHLLAAPHRMMSFMNESFM